MSNISNNEYWRNFFDVYQEMPELWKGKSDNFKDRSKKVAALNKLLDVYKKIEPEANIDTLKKRLHNIKTCYRRELKKIEQSQRAGASPDEEYIPTLWYFDKLHFLREQEAQIPEVSTIDVEIYEPESCLYEETENFLCPLPNKRRNVSQHIFDRNSIGRGAIEQLGSSKELDDTSKIFSAGWAASYRELSPTQQIYAKKAIEDIFILGKLNLLSLHTVTFPSNINSPPPTDPFNGASYQSSTQ